MTARREVTCTVAEMQPGDEWIEKGWTVKQNACAALGKRLLVVEESFFTLRPIPADLTVTVLRAEPTVDVPVSVIEDVRTFIRWTQDVYGVHHALQQRILDALLEVEVK